MPHPNKAKRQRRAAYESGLRESSDGKFALKSQERQLVCGLCDADVACNGSEDGHVGDDCCARDIWEQLDNQMTDVADSDSELDFDGDEDFDDSTGLLDALEGAMLTEEVAVARWTASGNPGVIYAGRSRTTDSRTD